MRRDRVIAVQNPGLPVKIAEGGKKKKKKDKKEKTKKCQVLFDKSVPPPSPFL